VKGEGCRVESLGGGARALPHIARIAHLSLARAGRKEVRHFFITLEPTVE
jgi:hypothetical protein